MLTAASAACFFLTMHAQQPAGKLILAKGQKMQLDNSVKTILKLEMMGEQMEMTADMAMQHHIEVKDKTDSSYFINSTLTKLKSSANAMGQIKSFDSEKKEDVEGDGGKMLKDVLNVTKQTEYTQQAKIINHTADTVSSPANADVMNLLNCMLNGEANEGNSTAEVFLLVPFGKKPGDSWADSSTSEGIKVFRNFTLKSVLGNKATVAVTGNQVTNKKIEQMGMEAFINLNSSIIGESVTDINTGILQQKTMSMDGTGTAEMMGQTIPVTAKIVADTKVVNR